MYVFHDSQPSIQYFQVDQAQLDALTPLQISKMAAKIAETEAADLLLMGKLAIDGDYGQTAAMTAAILDWPQATNLYSVRYLFTSALKTRLSWSTTGITPLLSEKSTVVLKRMRSRRQLFFQSIFESTSLDMLLFQIL